MVDPNGRPRVVRVGQPHTPWGDLYHWLLTLTWPGLVALVTVLYLAINALFAWGYVLGGDCIENAEPGSFADAFFFSIQTMSTIGYGAMHPKTIYANTLVVMEIFIGILGVAMVTGLMFARFSRPTSRVMFSRVAVISTYNGVPTLMFRTANQRRNQILEANLRVVAVQSELNAEGHFMRRIRDLKLIRDETPIFGLSWLAMHTIDETSPLWGTTPESLAEKETEIVVTLTGIDDTFSQTVHARHSYIASEILWDRAFVDIFFRCSDGRYAIDYNDFHKVESLSDGG